MSRFEIYTVHFLSSGLNNEDEKQSATLHETLYCTSTRRASSRYAGETGMRKPPQQRMGEKGPCAAPARLRACTRTPSPCSFLLLENSLQPTPSPLFGLASWPLLGA